MALAASFPHVKTSRSVFVLRFYAIYVYSIASECSYAVENLWESNSRWMGLEGGGVEPNLGEDSADYKSVQAPFYHPLSRHTMSFRTQAD